MKTAKRISAILLTLLLVVVLSVGAAAETFTYTAVNGGPTSVDKYLVMDANANVPPVTFTYAIAAGEAIDATTTTFAVKAGPTPTAVTVGTAAFTAADTKYTTVQTNDHVTLASGQAYAKKQVALDFTGVSFSEPGVYRYILTENQLTEGNTAAFTYDVQNSSGTSRQRTLDVYVTDNGSGTLVVSAYVLHTGLAAPSKTATEAYTLDDKSYGYVNNYATKDLTFSKTVSGNQASRDKFFKFTVTISNAVAGTKFSVVLTNASASISANPNEATTCITAAVTQPTELIVPTGATSVSQDFYLQDGQSITIRGLATGTGYAVTENAEDYSSSNPSNASGTISGDNVTVAFTNTRDGVVPTGVMLTLAPGLAVAALAGAGLCLLGRRKKDGER